MDNAERHLEQRVKVSGGQVYVGQDLNKVLIHAEDEAKAMGDEYVSVEHLFLCHDQVSESRHRRRSLRSTALPENGFCRRFLQSAAISA